MHLINDMKIGGAQRLLSDLLPIQTEGKDSISLVVLRQGDDEAFMSPIESENKIRLVNLNIEEGAGIISYLRKLPMLRKEMKKHDICHVHLFPSLYLAAIASLFSKIKLIYTEHNTFNRRRLNKALRPVEKLVYSSYSRVICISQAVRNNLALWLDRQKDDSCFCIVANGIPVSRFSHIREELKKEGKDICGMRQQIFGREGLPVLMISRFVDSKDQATLIRAISSVNNKDAYVVLVGDGPRRKEYEYLVQEYGVENKVVFLGSRSDIAVLISISEIGVQSSNWEGFGLTAVEMMAGGLPLIVSDVEGIAAVTKDVTLKFPRGDYKMLAQCMDRLLEDPVLRKGLVAGAERRAAEYDIAAMAEEYHKIYEEVLK